MNKSWEEAVPFEHPDTSENTLLQHIDYQVIKKSSQSHSFRTSIWCKLTRNSWHIVYSYHTICFLTTYQGYFHDLKSNIHGEAVFRSGSDSKKCWSSSLSIKLTKKIGMVNLFLKKMNEEPENTTCIILYPLATWCCAHDVRSNEKQKNNDKKNRLVDALTG